MFNILVINISIWADEFSTRVTYNYTSYTADSKKKIEHNFKKYMNLFYTQKIYIFLKAPSHIVIIIYLKISQQLNRKHNNVHNI